MNCFLQWHQSGRQREGVARLPPSFTLCQAWHAEAPAAKHFFLGFHRTGLQSSTVSVDTLSHKIPLSTALQSNVGDAWEVAGEVDDELLDQLDRSWSLGLETNWQDFLLSKTDPRVQDHAFLVCKIDLGWRVKRLASQAGPISERSIVVEVYANGSRAPLCDRAIQQLIACEFVRRWQCGLTISSQEFRAGVPAPWQPQRLQTVWNCSACGHEDIPFQESESSGQCPACGRTFPQEAIFQRGTYWHESNAPLWLRTSLVRPPEPFGKLGTFGCAYLLQDCDAHAQPTIVKVLHPHWCNDEVVRLRFQQESLVLSKLDGQGTPSLIRAGQLPDGRLYAQMQWIDGEVLAEETLPADFLTLFDRLEELAKAVAVAHDENIIHRDLSPLNVIIERRRLETIVLDWGQCRFLKHDADTETGSIAPQKSLPVSTATESGQRMGSRGFQAPELLVDPAAAQASADVFSLGSLFLYALTQKRVTAWGPHESLDTPNQESLSEVKSWFQSARQHGALVDEREFLDLCEKCINFDPLKRPTTARQVVERMAELKILRQQRLSVLPALRARNRLAWALLGVTFTSALLVATLLIIRQRESESHLAQQTVHLEQKQKLLERQQKLLKQQEVLTENNRRMAEDKTREAEKANAFSNLLLNMFNSAEPMGLEGFGLREPGEAVAQLDVAELLRRVAKRTLSDTTMPAEARASIMDSVGNVLRGLGNDPLAAELLLAAESIHNQPELKLSLRDQILLKFHLAILYHSRQSVQQAEDYYKTTLDLLESERDSELQNQVEFRYAWLLAETRRPELALLMFERIHKDSLSALGPNHPQSQAAEIGAIVTELSYGGNPTDILKRLTLISEPQSLMVSVMLAYLPASVARRQRQYFFAKPAYENLLKWLRNRVPPGHPLLGLLLGDMAGMYRECGETERAFALAEEARKIAKNTIPTHPRSLELYNGLADEYERQSDYAKALEVASELKNNLIRRDSEELSQQLKSTDERILRLERLLKSGSSTN